MLPLLNDRWERYPAEIFIIAQWHRHYGPGDRICELWKLSCKATEEYERDVCTWSVRRGQWPNWYRQWTLDYTRAKAAWDLADTVARVRWLSFEQKMRHMETLRELIGDEAYYSGVLPPIFPEGYPGIPRMR